MKYKIKQTTKFKKDFKRVIKRGADPNEFEKILMILASGETIPEKYRDHPLFNTAEYQDCRELHICPDWLLVYKYYSDTVILLLIRTGSHSDLF